MVVEECKQNKNKVLSGQHPWTLLVISAYCRYILSELRSMGSPHYSNYICDFDLQQLLANKSIW